MKRAVVVGGSSGIGLAISKHLIDQGYYIEILSRTEPEHGILMAEQFQHYYCDLYHFNEELIRKLSADPDVDTLIITAGFGRIADFESFTIAEIDKTITVNTMAVIKILRVFYDRLKNSNNFYCAVMGSIAGLVSSPMFAVYGAA